MLCSWEVINLCNLNLMQILYNLTSLHKFVQVVPEVHDRATNGDKGNAIRPCTFKSFGGII